MFNARWVWFLIQTLKHCFCKTLHLQKALGEFNIVMHMRISLQLTPFCSSGSPSFWHNDSPLVVTWRQQYMTLVITLGEYPELASTGPVSKIDTQSKKIDDEMRRQHWHALTLEITTCFDQEFITFYFSNISIQYISLNLGNEDPSIVLVVIGAG